MANSIGAALGQAGAGELVESLGQVWRFLPVSQDDKDEYVARLKLRARQSVISQREFLDPESYRDSLAAVSADIAAELYEWGGYVWRRSIQDTGGLSLLLSICLRHKHPKDATPEKALEILQGNPDGVRLILPALLGLDADPNRKAPARQEATPGPAEASLPDTTTTGS